MKNVCIYITILIISLSTGYSQSNSPYKTTFKVDAPVTAAGIGLSYWGMTMMHAKEGLTEEELEAVNIDQVNRFDRFAAGNFSLKAKKDSDFPFYGSFALPFFLLLDDNISSHAGQVALLYVQTMSVTGAIWTVTSGNVYRNRPLVYNTAVENNERKRSNAQNSFFAGHPAASASATFFAAKIFHDFNPDSPARPYVWAAAAAIPATVGYLRLRAGKHFLSDILVGYAVGAGAGILVPQLHKRANNKNITLVPVRTPDFSGAVVSYTF